MEFMERFLGMAKELTVGGEYLIVVQNTGQSCSQGLYKINGQTYSSDSNRLIEHPVHDELRWDAFDAFERGITLMRFIDGELVDRRNIRYFNPERIFTGAKELTIYQEYGLEPTSDLSKKYLEESIKAEKIKKTLVWACYVGDKESIQRFLSDPKIKPAQLNKTLKLEGTPLIICAKRDDVESFRAIAEKGADLGKKIACEDTPLMVAFRRSYDIVRYVYEEHREQFDKEVRDFSPLYGCKDERLFQLVFESGADMMCQEGKPMPLLHIYARNNNPVGLKFLLEHGVDIGLKNKDGLTALEIAEQKGSSEAIEFLREYR